MINKIRLDKKAIEKGSVFLNKSAIILAYPHTHPYYYCQVIQNDSKRREKKIKIR